MLLTFQNKYVDKFKVEFIMRLNKTMNFLEKEEVSIL